MAMLMVMVASAQNADLGTSSWIKEFWNKNIVPIFGVSMALVIVVSGLFNLSHFFGEHRDYKKGFSNVGVAVLSVGLIILLVSWISGLNLKSF